MKAYIELSRVIHQTKSVEIELTEQQIEDLCYQHECEPSELTYSHIHYSLVDCGNGDKLALNEDGWVNSNLERDVKGWDGCCDKLVHDNGSISEYDLYKGFNL